MKVTENIEITNEDNMALMARYPDNYFDLAIVDPPYGLGEDGGKNRKGYSKAWKNQKLKDYEEKDWDNSPENKDYFKELKRVSINQIIWGANHFIENIPNANSSGWICWYKAGQNPNSDFSKCEVAYSSFKRGMNYFKFDWTGFGAVNAKEHRIHPTQKPVKLYEWLLMNYAKEGENILDTHFGSGSLGIACHNLGFELTACELDKDYYNASIKRIQNHVSQQRLF